MPKRSRRFMIQLAVQLEMDIREKYGGVIPQKYEEYFTEFWKIVERKISKPKKGELHDLSKLEIPREGENLYLALRRMWDKEKRESK